MANQKILHLSENQLEDPRVIKSAMTGKESGNSVYFCGEFTEKIVTRDLYEGVEWISVPNKAKVAKPFSHMTFWPFFPYPQEDLKLKTQIHHAIEKIKPDIIHAHNIFVGHHALDEGIPMVFDDHELYSMKTELRSDNGSLLKKSKKKIRKKIWLEWETKIAEKCPVITPSNSIAEYYKNYNNDVFVVPNYPKKNFIKLEKFNEAKKDHLCSIYIGKDKPGDKNATRNISGLYDIFTTNKNVGFLKNIGVSNPNNSNIKSLGFVHFLEAYKLMQKYGHVGLIPFQKNWFHRFQSPNKAYEYAHCGLWVISINDITQVKDDFGNNCDLFDSFNELEKLLEYYNQNPEDLNKKRARSQEMAINCLIWEKNENKILEAYKKA